LKPGTYQRASEIPPAGKGQRGLYFRYPATICQEFKVQGFKVQGSGFRVQGSRFRVE